MRTASRRQVVLAAATAGALGLPAPSPARARPLQRLIWVVNQRNEELATTYRREDGGYDFNALARLQHLFRDVRENLPGPLPPPLIDVLAILQESFGFDRPLKLLSGYRTPRTNASLGEGAAPRSYHLQGKAADITIRGIPPIELALAAHSVSQRLGMMGIGLYGTFVHVDIGPTARWTRIRRS